MRALGLGLRIAALGLMIVAFMTAAEVSAQSIVAISWDSDVSTISAETGEGEQVGTTIFSGYNSMARRSDGTLYTAGGFQILTVNPINGEITSVGTYGFASQITGLAFGPDGLLYATTAHVDSSNLLAIDVDALEAFDLGPVGFRSVQGTDLFAGTECGFRIDPDQTIDQAPTVEHLFTLRRRQLWFAQRSW